MSIATTCVRSTSGGSGRRRLVDDDAVPGRSSVRAAARRRRSAPRTRRDHHAQRAAARPAVHDRVHHPRGRFVERSTPPCLEARPSGGVDAPWAPAQRENVESSTSTSPVASPTSAAPRVHRDVGQPATLDPIAQSASITASQAVGGVRKSGGGGGLLVVGAITIAPAMRSFNLRHDVRRPTTRALPPTQGDVCDDKEAIVPGCNASPSSTHSHRHAEQTCLARTSPSPRRSASSRTSRRSSRALSASSSISSTAAGDDAVRV